MATNYPLNPRPKQGSAQIKLADGMCAEVHVRDLNGSINQV
jgi:hypothetical protein